MKAGKIQYQAGTDDGGIQYTRILALDLNDNNFDKIFEDIALSDSGSAMMVGKLPVTDII